MRPLLLAAAVALAARSDPDAQVREIQKKIDRGELPKVEFDFDSADLRPETTVALDLIAEVMLENPYVKLRIHAHTDAIGDDKYNLELSHRRARAVKEYLVKLGVPPPSIRFRGYGASQPIGDNSTEEGRARNRRVEFVVVKRDWTSVY